MTIQDRDYAARVAGMHLSSIVRWIGSPVQLGEGAVPILKHYLWAEEWAAMAAGFEANRDLDLYGTGKPVWVAR